MKRIFAILLCCVLCFSLLCGCKKDIPASNQEVKKETEVVTLPVKRPVEFGYSSGAGGWYTSLTLKPDGTFVGSYQDSEMGDIGEDYPYGTVYICDFKGNFVNIEKVSDYEYKMTLENLVTDKKEGEEWIEDKIRYVSSIPYGLDGNNFILYTPDAPVENLSEEFLSWRQSVSEESIVLSVYGLYNVDTGAGFFESK